jgi:hypothetical protein
LGWGHGIARKRGAGGDLCLPVHVIMSSGADPHPAA